MLSNIFLGVSLIGAEWVLYFLILLSVISVAIIIERLRFYRTASKGLEPFRAKIRDAANQGKWEDALAAAQQRSKQANLRAADLETGMTMALLSCRQANDKGKPTSQSLNELAQDAVLRTRIHWERNLAILASIGSNAPFVGLFGTVLGIIKAFHDLAKQPIAGAQTVSAGVSEALVATAVGILVAIPATVAFNFFQRRVKSACLQAEALKSFLVGKTVE